MITITDHEQLVTRSVRVFLYVPEYSRVLVVRIEYVWQKKFNEGLCHGKSG